MREQPAMKIARLLPTVLVAALACREADGRVVKNDKSREQNTEVHHVASVVGFKSPESAQYDPEQDVWFVTNIFGFGSDRDGKGFITRIPAGQIDSGRVFAQSDSNGVQLDAPKGMVIQGDTLWVADIDKVRGFNRKTGAPVGTIDLAGRGVTMLNDMGLAPDGTLRVTDTGILMTEKGVLRPGGDKIFSIGAGHAIKIVASGEQLHEPNGIKWDATNSRWVVVGFKRFNSEVDAYDSTFAKQTRVTGNGGGEFDGLVVLPNGNLLYTCWTDSSIHAFSNAKDERLIRFVPVPASIGYDTRRGVVAVPMAMDDQVQFFALPERLTGLAATAGAGKR
jgi:sugar lactone lactonase YvrE